MPKALSHVAARRKMGHSKDTRKGAKVFAYFTPEEKDLVQAAAERQRRSMSSFVAEAAIAAAEDMLDRKR